MLFIKLFFKAIFNLFINIIPFLIVGYFIGRNNPKASENISVPLVKYGIPISVMGLLLKVGINFDLLKSALLAFCSISLLVILINKISFFYKLLPNYTLQLGGLIGNTSFLGIPIAIALLPQNTINFTIGFDLGTTLFAWIIGPYLLQKRLDKYAPFNFKKLLLAIFKSPASKGLIGVVLAYLFALEEYLGDFLWLPARIVICIAIIIVGTRLGIITKGKKDLFKFNKEIKNAIITKLFLLPIIVFVTCIYFNFEKVEIAALVLQGATPTAISTILMSEAYKKNQDIAAKTLFLTTITSILTIPALAFLLQR